jgi:hypothetical protein
MEASYTYGLQPDSATIKNLTAKAEVWVVQAKAMKWPSPGKFWLPANFWPSYDGM